MKNIIEPQATTPSHDEISKTAYYIWENEGRPLGREFEFWMRAEALLREQALPTPTPSARSAPASKPVKPRTTSSRVTMPEIAKKPAKPALTRKPVVKRTRKSA